MRRPLSRALAVLVTTGLALLVLAWATGCSPTTSGPSPGASVPPSSDSSSTPPATMEAVIAELTALRRAAQTALDEQFGARPWEISTPEGDVVSRSSCGPGEDADGETAYLPGYGFRGTYSPRWWKQAAETVLRIARAHGFADVVVLSDQPEDYLVDAHRPDGAQLQLGFASNTSLGLQTGCHRWAAPPGPGPVPAD